MKQLLFKALGFLAFIPGIQAQKQSGSTGNEVSARTSLYDFQIPDIEGNVFALSTLKGKKIMIVNTASRCGLTPQYRDLQALYERFRDKDFVILAFPSNDFMMQEPGSNENIATFCETQYGITFPLMSKIHVKGNQIHPLYAFLTQKRRNGVMDSEVKWNFQKYLINEDGVLEKVMDPKVNPLDPDIIRWIEK